jgi:DNA-binding NarL/FixJ family response regulator/anti-sigma regulatory factor (Ser/Thr protein kinase)
MTAVTVPARPLHIALIDTSRITRDLITAGLRDTFSMYSAANLDEATTLLRTHHIDIAIIDTQLPSAQRNQLLTRIRTHFPHIKIALMTGQDMLHTIDTAQQNDIETIFTKSVPYNFDEITTFLRAVATQNIFGLQRYMGASYRQLKTYTLRSSADLEPIEKDIAHTVATFHRYHVFIEILLDEILTNAMYHAPVDTNGRKKYGRNTPITLEEHEYVQIRLGRDDEKYGISVLDNSGRLSKQQVIYRLRRQMKREGVFDENGRGLFLSWSFADRLIFNIRKNTATEVIAINYYDTVEKSVKPLYVNEIE